MTFLELVHSIIPDLTDAEADHLLWEHTPFPFEPWWEYEAWIVSYHGEIVARSTHLGAI